MDHGGRSRDGWTLGGQVASLLLLWSCLSPLLSAYTPLPDVSGSEGALALASWLLALLLTNRVTGLDWCIGALGLWACISAWANDLPTAAAGLYVALLVAPFTFLRLVVDPSDAATRSVTRVLRFAVGAQLVMLLVQLLTRSGVDDLKGTFVGTQYGEHVAAFMVLVGSAAYALRHPELRRAKWGIGLAIVAAYVADSKMSLVYFGAVGLAYILFGRNRTAVRQLQAWKRIAIGAAGATALWMFYIGAFGNIALSGYVDQTTHTGGGKLVVSEVILSPTSQLWSRESYLLGAGPAQTVSRTAGLTVPNSHQTVAPAAVFGLPRGEYYRTFERLASGQGYVAQSSATKAASSLLGVMGDLGLVGLALYAACFAWVWRWVGRRLGYLSWPALAWLGLLIPGFLGEWLEFPPSCMFLAAVLAVMVHGRTATPSGEPVRRRSAAGAAGRRPAGRGFR